MNIIFLQFPLGMSIAVTYISAITVIGFPSECYTYGVVTWWLSFNLIFANVFAIVYYIPFWYRLQLSSIYMGSTQNNCNIYVITPLRSLRNFISYQLTLFMTSKTRYNVWNITVSPRPRIILIWICLHDCVTLPCPSVRNSPDL